MLKINENYKNLKDSYLFYNIEQRIDKYEAHNPGKKLYRLGIGDVTLPLCPIVIDALKAAVEDQAHKETFRGYLPECGAPFLQERIAWYYSKRGVQLDLDEIFISVGAADELGNILDLFDKSSKALIVEPTYPAYVDSNIMAGREIIHLPSGIDNGFLPMPSDGMDADIIYICSPNNPTGAVYTADGLKKWVDFARARGAVILFDAAYEAFIEDETLPHSIFEIDGAKECAIEICSLSKTAGFTGTRLGYTIVPKALERGGTNLNKMWIRNRTTKSNGVSYIIQKGAAAVFTDEGRRQIQKNIDVYKSNARTLMNTFDSLGIWYTGGKNAPYVWIKCPNGMSSWDYFDLLLNEIQVVGTPGEGFGKSGEGYFRFSMFGDPDDTAEAAKRILNLQMSNCSSDSRR